MNERRTSRRESSLYYAIRARYVGPSGVECFGAIKDLSDGGATVVGDSERLRVGDKVDLTLLLPLDGELRYQAKVAHLSPNSWGAELLKVHPSPPAARPAPTLFHAAALH